MVDWLWGLILGLLGLEIIWAVVEVIFTKREANRKRRGWEDTMENKRQ